jgi:multiple RNA-binding domain-containing protein 1
MAYVTFIQSTCALKAYESLDKKSFQGRLLHILPAVDRKGKAQTDEGDGKKRTLKDQKHAQRKADAGKEFNWGMLYMNVGTLVFSSAHSLTVAQSDAVLSSISDRLKISKADMLDPESDNAAVKIALAETHVITETKTYLESQGVILSAFSSRARSDTTILVKNIPYGTTAEQIREIFEPHGELDRIIVPPAGTMAVVEFVHADEAKKAYKAVAYRRLGNTVIYLEKGPIGMFGAVEDRGPSRGDHLHLSSGVTPIAVPEQPGEGEETEDFSEGTTLFVKNLSFSTTTERLIQVLRTLPGFSYARVQTKPDPKRPGSGARLSMGYGFVGFRTVEAARKALKGLHGYVLDGHTLHVKFAGRGRAEEVEKSTKDPIKSRTTKMIVKNVPFEATKKDLRELFG